MQCILVGSCGLQGLPVLWAAGVYKPLIRGQIPRYEQLAQLVNGRQARTITTQSRSGDDRVCIGFASGLVRRTDVRRQGPPAAPCHPCPNLAWNGQSGCGRGVAEGWQRNGSKGLLFPFWNRATFSGKIHARCLDYRLINRFQESGKGAEV